MSLKYLWNKLEKMDSLEQQAYIENIFKQFDITPYYPVADNFKNIDGKESSGKNPLGYILMHLAYEQLDELIPKYFRELCDIGTFQTDSQFKIIDTVQSATSCIKYRHLSNIDFLFVSEELDKLNTDEMLEVFEFGVGKYSPWSFLKLNPYTLVPALFRHLYKYYYISKTDEETNVSHLAHAACNIRMIQLIIERGSNNA